MKALSIPGRLAAGFAAVLALTILLALLSMSRMAAIQRNLDGIAGARLAAVDMIGRMRYDVVSVSEQLRDVIFPQDEDVRRAAATRLQGHVADYFATLARLKAVALTPREQALMKEMVAAQDAAVRGCDGAMTAALQGRTGEAAALLDANDVRTLETAWIDALGRMVALQHTLAAEAARDARAEYEASRSIAFALAGAAVLLGAAIAWLTSRSIVRPLAGAVAVAEQVARGRLDVAIDTRANDEIGRLMRSLWQMTRSLTAVVGEARHISDAILGASGRIMQGNEHLSQRTEEQSSSVQQTACSMEQFTRTICSNTASAEQANRLADSARTVATQGGEAVVVVRQTMETISESATRIAGIINVIDGVAFQTNILALNAAVEAARAGEQGRGFAVVAAEVRQLAHRAASAARDIKQLVAGSVSRIETGSALALSAEATMNEIVGGVNRVAGIMAEITRASKEQSAGIGQVNDAIGCIDEAARHNLSLVADANRTTQDMKALAARLADVVGVFRLPAAAQNINSEEQA